MKSTLFSFLSHFIGYNSDIVPPVNITLSMYHNIILSVVCFGLFTSLQLLLIPSLPVIMAMGFSLVVLLCALPFELLNSRTQVLPSLLPSPDGYKYPYATQFFMLLSSVMGAIQYMIRNYSLLLNFTYSGSGVAFLKGLNQVGYAITAARFAVLGGFSAFAYHFLLAYSNWDKYTKLQVRDPEMLAIARLFWVLVMMFVLLEISISMQTTVLMGLGVWGLQFVRTPRWVKKGMQYMKKTWIDYAYVCLPLGAFLYGMVDLYNSYSIVSQLGWLNVFTLYGCAIFGLLSFANVSMIWGYNMVRYMYKGPYKEKNDSRFAKMYYCDPSVRRLSVYLKEGMLCMLDLLSNQVVLNDMNQALMLIFGFQVGLFALNLCTVCFAVNKVLIMMFQSGDQEIEYMKSQAYKHTPLAKFARRAIHALEVDIPNYLFEETAGPPQKII